MMADRKYRVLGKMLGQHIGKSVIVVGTITNVNSSGEGIEFSTLDDTKINVTLPNPLDGSTEGFFEIWGSVVSKGTMRASQLVRFDEEKCKDLDKQKYNDAIVLLSAMQNPWKLNAESEPL